MTRHQSPLCALILFTLLLNPVPLGARLAAPHQTVNAADLLLHSNFLPNQYEDHSVLTRPYDIDYNESFSSHSGERYIAQQGPLTLIQTWSSDSVPGLSETVHLKIMTTIFPSPAAATAATTGDLGDLESYASGGQATCMTGQKADLNILRELCSTVGDSQSRLDGIGSSGRVAFSVYASVYVKNQPKILQHGLKAILTAMSARIQLLHLDHGVGAPLQVVVATSVSSRNRMIVSLDFTKVKGLVTGMPISTDGITLTNGTLLMAPRSSYDTLTFEPSDQNVYNGQASTVVRLAGPGTIGLVARERNPSGGAHVYYECSVSTDLTEGCSRVQDGNATPLFQDSHITYQDLASPLTLTLTAIGGTLTFRVNGRLMGVFHEGPSTLLADPGQWGLIAQGGGDNPFAARIDRLIVTSQD